MPTVTSAYPNVTVVNINDVVRIHELLPAHILPRISATDMANTSTCLASALLANRIVRRTVSAAIWLYIFKATSQYILYQSEIRWSCCDNFPFAMPPKRSHLVSPNPVKHQMTDVEPHRAICEDDDKSESKKTPLSSSPPAVSSSQSLQSCPASPGLNRAKFFGQHASSGVVCNLDLCKATLGSKVHITGVVTAVYPASQNPDRRYILLSDPTGTVGLTVWNANVAKFSSDSVGSILNVEKVVLSMHNSKKILNLTRESILTMHVDSKHALISWWTNLAQLPPISLAAVQNAEDNAVVSVAGILGLITTEAKNVGSQTKTLMTLQLADSTGTLNSPVFTRA